MPILDRYLGRIILHYTLLAMLLLVGLFVFFSFLEQLDDLGRGEYGLPEAAYYIVLTLPRLIYELFPLATLLGTIIGLSLLANDLELTAMRASGVSLWQIILATLKIGACFIIIAMLFGELLAPHSESAAKRHRATALQDAIEQQTDSGLWLRDKHTYINVSEVLPDLTLLRIKIFEFSADRKLRTLIYADHGSWQQNSWKLNNVKKTVLHADRTTTTVELPSSNWPSAITQKLLSVLLVKPEQLSVWQLRRYIRHLEENQQQTEIYKLALWNKLMLPVSTAVMMILAIPFVFVGRRPLAGGRSLFIGIILGLGFYALHKGFGYITLGYGWPPLLGATLPVLIFLCLAIVKLRTVR